MSSSLNWKEIDLVLSELDLTGSHLQEVRQPDYRNLYLFCYKQGGGFWLRICLDNRAVRLHATRYPPAKPKKPQRFAEFLNKRVRGGRVREVEHLNQDRIIELTVERTGEILLLFIQLWGGSANIVVTDSQHRILDAFFRKPLRGIATGVHYTLPETRSPPAREVREWPREGSFNSFLDESFRRSEQEEQVDSLAEKLEKWWEREQGSYNRRVSALNEELASFRQELELGRYGDIIMANLHRLEGGEEWLEAEDFTRNGDPILIRLDPHKSGQENARHYYERAKRARRGVEALQEEIQRIEAEHRSAHEEYEALKEDPDPKRLKALTSDDQPPAAAGSRGRTGLTASSRGFTILIGRNARENDELLRRHVRGNDWWLHTRDFPGGYVFIKAQPGKSVPLDVLLDAGNLALFYSKGRENGQGELYYTQVKHLRRAKGGKKGTVLPTQEKNLHVDLDEARVRSLLS
ncbi:MAG: NFACT RNA binding domain-containing protein [Spirochaetaceae bacterium]